MINKETEHTRNREENTEKKIWEMCGDQVELYLPSRFSLLFFFYSWNVRFFLCF